MNALTLFRHAEERFGKKLIQKDMKINSQKMLLFLYLGKEKKTASVSYAHLPLLFPELSSSGQRALVYHLSHSHLLFTNRKDERTTFSLTPLGESRILEVFPFLSSFKNEKDTGDNTLFEMGKQSTTCLVFHTAPKSDPHFRLLRLEAVKTGFFPLQRSVYLYLGKPPQSFVEFCQKGYSASIVLLESENWLLNNQFLFLESQAELIDLKKSLSGISKEIARLIASKDEKKTLNHQPNLIIISLYERIFTLLRTSSPFVLKRGEILCELKPLLDQFSLLIELLD